MEQQQRSTNPEVSSMTLSSHSKRDWRFWGVFIAITVAVFTSALDFTAVSTALPIISNELHGSQFVWVGSAFALSSTAFLPMSGGLAQAFGRRPVMLASLALFAVGSIVCGVAPSMNVLIAGRTVQGVGAGGITSLTQIILSDLVSLRERGFFNGLNGIAWSIACGVGPLIGGAFAQRGAWRWLFYLNIFTSGLSAILVTFLLRLKTPPGTIREKLARMDWIGNVLIIASSSSCMIALTWGGVQYPWSSARVLVPLILGLAGLAFFLLYEAKWAKYPIVPFYLMSSVTGLSGYLQNFFSYVVLLGFIYYIPVYFQACTDASAIGSGVDVFSFVFVVAPFGIFAGISVAMFKTYRPQLWIGWSLSILGIGLLILVKASSPKALAIVFQAIFAMGMGPITTTTYFPVLSPLPVSANAHALACLTFVRFFGQVWGITIGATVLQNELLKRLPAEFVATFPQGTLIAYSIIPTIPTLPPPLRDAVRVAFAESLRVLWSVLVGILGMGLISSLAMKHIPLHSYKDDDWGLRGGEKMPIGEGSPKNHSSKSVQGIETGDV